MNNFNELKTLKDKLEQYKLQLAEYEGNIHPKKVIATLNKIMEDK